MVIHVVPRPALFFLDSVVQILFVLQIYIFLNYHWLPEFGDDWAMQTVYDERRQEGIILDTDPTIDVLVEKFLTMQLFILAEQNCLSLTEILLTVEVALDESVFSIVVS